LAGINLRPTFTCTEDRFWSKVDKSGGPDACWPWIAGKQQQGYGVFSRDGKSANAHRVAFDLANGPIPAGLFVCHTCDNPPCCNPAHLFSGTHSDNMRDKVAKGRNNSRPPLLVGAQIWTARLTEADVREIRRLRQAGWQFNDLAEEYAVSLNTVRRVVYRESWAHVV
jgi:hypothetical protein